MRRTLTLSAAEQATLVALRDHHPKPYLRERAAALLKIAAGAAPAQVARSGLLRSHRPDTLYAWLNRYAAYGLAGLYIRPGRGRKPAFSPSPLATDPTQTELPHLVRRDPHGFGLNRSRWPLATLGQVHPGLAGYSLSGRWRLLDRHRLHWKRGRFALHRPDPDYAAAANDTIVTLYQDEAGILRQPSLASAWAPVGREQALAHRSYRSETVVARLAATLDPRTGRVLADRYSRIRVADLVAFYQQVVASSPQAERIYLIQDNWPLHRHPDVLVALEPQELSFPAYRPANWPSEPQREAVGRWGGLQLPIQLVPLPTYAPWCNPIEKLWRKLKQEVIHLHRQADDLPALREMIDDVLEPLAHGSPEVLRYVGLVPH